MLHHKTASFDAHTIISWVYANAVERTSASGFVDTDVGRVAWQTDEDALFFLKSTVPEWVRIQGSGGSGSSGAVYWTDVLNKPATYPPSTHTHAQYANAVHGHAISDVTGLQTALDGKAPAVHSHDTLEHDHPLADIIGWPAGLTTTELAYLDGVTGAIQPQLDGKAATDHGHGTQYASFYHTHLNQYSPVGHEHTSGSITDFAEAVDDRVNTLLVVGTGINKNYNDASNTLTLSSVVNFFDAGSLSGSVNLTCLNGRMQRVSLSGSSTITITEWDSAGVLSEFFLEVVNGSSLTEVTNVKWIRPDGTTTTSLTTAAYGLQSSPQVDFILLWTRDAGSNIYGKVVR